MTMALRSYFDRPRATNGTAAIVFTLASAAILVGHLFADEPAKPAAEKATPQPVELVVDPAPEPLPALKYQLLTPPDNTVAGNAAPIYLRIIHERGSEWLKRLGEEPSRLLDMPADEMPMDDALKLLNSYDSAIEQLSAAGRRADCNWEYVLESGDPLLILLPDAQFMRSYGRLLAVRARYESRKRDFPAAVSSLRDGLMLSQHVAKAPFLVNRLIAYVISSLMLEQMDTLVQQTGAPNLYWALTMLPRPLVSFESATSLESRLLELRFADLADMDRERSAEQWERQAKALRNWAAEVIKNESAAGAVASASLAAVERPSSAAQLEAARNYLREVQGLSAERVPAMTDGEVEVRYTMALYHELSDAWRKWFYVPVQQAAPVFPHVIESLKADALRREIYPLVSLITPIGANLVATASRCDRMRSRLQTIEALRMHASATGKLPEKLAEVTVVPIPFDPATGEPFRYSLDGDVATIDLAEELGTPRDSLRMPTRVRLRSK